MGDTEIPDEVTRLRALTLAQATKINELEELVAACLRRGARLHEALTYYDDDGGPKSRNVARDALKEARRQL